jgi:primosomal protein N' (replication factor Y)
MFNQKYAQVIADVPLLHVDRPFDYVVPENLESQVHVGSRVAISFGGRKAIGYVSAIVDSTERPDKVSEIESVIDGLPVVTPEIFELSRLIADRYIATQGDVLGAAIPKRLARTESRILDHLPIGANPINPEHSYSTNWNFYANGNSYLHRLENGEVARATCVVGPGHDIFEMTVDAVVASRKADKGVIVALADAKEVDRFLTRLRGVVSNEDIGVFGSDQKPSERYANFLNVLRGDIRIAVGTRSAVFAPISNLGLVVIVDDGDDSFAEQQNPAWHAREILAIRSLHQDCSFFAISTSRSVEVQQMIQRDWLVDLICDRNFLRTSSPKIYATSDSDLAKDPVARHARLPQMVFSTIRTALLSGPVLVQVPRRGYQLHVSCSQCREAVYCKECHGAVARDNDKAPLSCMRCGHKDLEWKCQWCGNRNVRSTLVGDARTAEELGRAFPGVAVKTSGKNSVIDSVDNQPALVISTPGAEPIVQDGFFEAAVILDAEMSLRRIDLRAEEESFRRWQYVVSLVKPETGRVVVVADESKPIMQALIRHDAIGFAERELDLRKSAHMPPAFGVIEVRCDEGLWLDALDTMKFPELARVLGPVVFKDNNPNIPNERVLITYPRSIAAQVTKEIRTVIAKRTASKAKGKFHAKVDPVAL